MSANQIQDLYKELVNLVIISDPKMSSQKPDFEFKTGTTLVLKITDRNVFKTEFEAYLKKEKITFSAAQSGSSIGATKIDFKKYYPGLKPLTIVYKPKGAAGKPPTVKTAWQEQGAAYIFEQALVNNVDYEKNLKDAMSKFKTSSAVLSKKVLPEDILLEAFKDDLKKLREIFEVKANSGFPYVDWLNSFYFSQKVLLAKYSKSTFQRFDRDGGFMAYITKLVQVKFNIARKDTWNPADVWAVKGSEQTIQKFIDDGLKNVMDYKDASKKYEGAQLEDYIRAGILCINSLLIDLLTGTNPKVVGISLKLTDSGAYIEEVNFDKVKKDIKANKALIDTVENPFKIDPKEDFQCNFAITQGTKSKGTFTQDVRIFAEDLNNNSVFNFQIKALDSAKINQNLKFELTIQGKGAARGGKVPVDYLLSLTKKLKPGGFANDNSKYPKTSKEFMDNLTKGKNYQTMFKKVSSNVKDIGVDDYEGFVANVLKAFNSDSVTASNATCKLMGFEFLYFLLTLEDKKMRGLITDMAYLAQKKNTRGFDTFGPFIKIA